MRVKSVDGIDARRLPIDKDAGAAISGNHLPSLHFSPETGSILAVARTIPGGMPPRARREHFHRIPTGSIYYSRSRLANDVVAAAFKSTGYHEQASCFASCPGAAS